MIKRAVGVLVFLLICTSVSSGQQNIQDNRILFRGVVISSSTQERLAGSQIIINRRFYTASYDDGTFSFYAEHQDTVLFTLLGYKPTSLIVSDTLRSKEFLAGVYMQEDTLEIGEVIIVPRLRNLKADIMNPKIVPDVQRDNAITNITIASYVGRTTQPRMGDPYINYQVLRSKQKRAAYEKGGIPSDQMVSISPFLLIPAAYLLLHGMPETPPPPKPEISSKDIDELNKLYLEMLRNKK